MKTLFKSLICTLILILGASIQSEAFASAAEDYITVNGIVKDSQTKKKVEYATISIPGTTTSTISNVDGEFSLKIKSSVEARELVISHESRKR